MDSPAFTSSFTGVQLTSKPQLTTTVTQPQLKKRYTTPKAVLGSRTFSSPYTTTQAPRKYQVTVMQKDRCTVLEVDSETNLRKALLDAKVDLYTLGGKLRNCGGGGQCGTCTIDVEEGLYMTNGRSVKEEVLLEGKPETWRLACRTTINGDITIRTKPKA